VGLAYTTTLQRRALAWNGCVTSGCQALLFLGARYVMGNVLNNSIDRMADGIMFDPFQTELDNINSANNQSPARTSQKLKKHH